MAAAAGALLLGALFGVLAVLARPSTAEDLIPEQFFTQSPRERVESIEKEEERIATLDDAAMFGAQLYTPNIRVSFLAFGLSAVSLVAGVWILFYNGILLGAVATTYLMDGVSLFFFAWVGPHGALELPAIAGLIEGSFSQFSAKTVPYPLKIAVAVALHLGLLAYLFVPRREEGA